MDRFVDACLTEGSRRAEQLPALHMIEPRAVSPLNMGGT